MLSCKIIPKLRFLANWHREPAYPNHDLHRKQATHTLNLHRKQAKQNLTCTGSKSKLILTCTGSKSNNPILHRKQVKQSYKHR